MTAQERREIPSVAWATQRRPGDSAIVHSALETQGSGRSPPDALGHGWSEVWHPRVFSRTDPACLCTVAVSLTAVAVREGHHQPPSPWPVREPGHSSDSHVLSSQAAESWPGEPGAGQEATQAVSGQFQAGGRCEHRVYSWGEGLDTGNYSPG